MEKQNDQSLEKRDQSDEIDLNPPRISIRHIVDTTLGILNFDRGLLFTIRELLLRPAKAIDNYLFNDRSRFIHPLRFLFLSAAIAAFLSTQLVFTAEEFSVGLKEGIEVNADDEDAVSDSLKTQKEIPDLSIQKDIDDLTPQEDAENEEPLVKTDKGEFTPEEIQQAIASYMLDIINRYFSLFLILYVPFAALFTLLFFRKNKYFFGEHLAVNAYLVSMANVFYIIAIPFMLFEKTKVVLLIYVLVTGTYQTILYIKVFKRKWMAGLLRSSLAIFFSATIYSLAVLSVLGLLLNIFLSKYGIS